ncbi:MAG TPA: UBP-type zinc finger domain-containing protein [Acidobacteriaceae bacterium]|nr:UBP-type zinc finger domain-containing protein [Acidobacteriaceae bacterium]
MALCKDLVNSKYTAPKSQVCAECVALGDEWVHLRTCLACGHVGCCDSSKNRHATKHFKTTGHPVICSAQPGERWLWCYVHEQMAE